MNLTDNFVANGGSLEEMSAIKPVVRAVYGCIRSSKPNDHCYWDSDFGLWMEDDATFRDRIISEQSK